MKKGVYFLLLILIAFLTTGLFIMNQSNNRMRQEIELLQSMKIDEEDLSSLYEGEISSEWLVKYREIGNRFVNYVCEYGGSKNDVMNIIVQYEEYGREILAIADYIEEGKNEDAKKAIVKLMPRVEVIENSLGVLYEKYN